MGILDWIKDYLKDIRKSTGKTFKNIVLTAHFWVILISLALIITSLVNIFSLLADRKDQYMADYWKNGGKTDFRQLTAFAVADKVGDYVPLYQNLEEDAFTLKNIKEMRKTLQGTVNSGKMIASNDNGKEIKLQGWEDCYSSFFRTKATKDSEIEIGGVKKTDYRNADCEVVAVGGNFTAFHPFEYLAGGFFPSDGSVNEFGHSIVINDNLAWELYKSYDICGQKLTIWGEDFTIVGVVREKTGEVDKTTGASDNRIYCYFSKIEQLNEDGVFSEGKDSVPRELAVNCYEAMLPEVVRGVARNDMLTALPSYNASNPKQLIVSNTGRFMVNKVYDQNMPIGEFESKTKQYEFPYWERASILATERIFLFELVFLAGVFIMIIGIVLIALRVRRSKYEPEIETDENEDPSEDKISNTKLY